MKIKDLDIAGATLLEFNVFKDDRGSFTEIFNLANFNVAQVNKSNSNKGVLRGIHFADVPPGQAKYITCVSGSILDVLVDLRKSSPTFKKWIAIELSEENNLAVSIPVGVGHAFLALQDNSTVIYLCDQKYNPKVEHELDAFDKNIGINWPSHLEIIRSEKDRNAPGFDEMFSILPD